MSELAKQNAPEPRRFRPATDILEREDGFYVLMDLPGVSKEDMTIDLKDNELTVSGRTSLAFGEGENFIETQFADCEFIRSVAISDLVDRESISASLENGVLELHLPKAQKLQPKRIDIKAN